LIAYKRGCSRIALPSNPTEQTLVSRLVCEVAFHEWTSDGKMKAPSFLGLRDDKKPNEVAREI
jgi:ATP-dependent DNA ligase